MRCDNCNNQETYVKDYEHNYIIKGKNISFIAKRRFCKLCNSLVYDSVLDNLVSKIAICKYNEFYAYSKEEIINLKERYNLSKEQFANMIGCDLDTLDSWIKGKLILNDSCLNNLLNLKD